ncbi:MAG: MBG domain-containing protein, partial [Verrucomicrobiia bacterium]
LAVTFTYNGSATAPTSAGSYTVVGTINDPNYQGSATGTLVIAQASGSITLGNLSQTYTGSAKTATATTTPSGLAVTFTYNGSATAPTSAGSYTVVGTINDANYQGSTTGTLVINPAPLTITATANTKTYDGNTSAAAIPTATGLQGFDTVANLAETYDTQNAGTGKSLNVSAYVVNDGNGGANYTVTTVASSAGVINPATLTVTADDKSRMCGQPNPVLTASYAGFISGEGTNVLTSLAVLSTTATINSTAGEYPITAGGASAANYTVTYADGTLTVIQAPQLSCAEVNAGGNNQFIVSWSSITNQTYQLEFTTNLAAPTWTPMGSPLPGTGAVLAVTNSMNGIPQCFFRVELQ